MLKNNGAAFVLRYNGMEKYVEEGALVDVRDFNILNQDVKVVERHLLRKYGGRFEAVSGTDGMAESPRKYEKQIVALNDEVEELKKQVAKMKDANRELSDKLSSQSEQIHGFGALETGYKNQITALKGQIKELEEEHKAHISRIMGGKK